MHKEKLFQPFSGSRDGRPAGSELEAIQPSHPSAITGVPAVSRHWMDSRNRAEDAGGSP